jgi:hypothetical protein
MCRLIAHNMVNAIAANYPQMVGAGITDWDTFHSLYQALDPYLTTEEWANDTHFNEYTTR